MMMRTVLCYGDSNTHGTRPMPSLDGAGRFGPADRWPRVMGQALGTGWEVVEEGHPGRTTLHDDPVEGAHRNGLTILPAVLESHQPIDLVIVMLGTNDLKPRFAVHAPDIALSLGRLARIIKASSCGPEGGAPQVLLVAPPPIIEVGCLAEMFEGGAARSQGLGRWIKAAAAREGVGFLDAGDIIAVSPIDGIHYAAEAQQALGKVLAAAVQRQFGGK